MKHVKLFEQFVYELNEKDMYKIAIDTEVEDAKIGNKFYNVKKGEIVKLIDDNGDVATVKLKSGEVVNIESKYVVEGRIALNHVYANAPVRNKVLEILKNGRVTEQDFMDAVSKSGAPSKWISRNSHFFKVEEEDGVKYYSLSKTGHVIMSAINEAVDVESASAEDILEIYEEFGLEENLVVDPLDLTTDFFYVSINGKVYGYKAKSGDDIQDVASTFKKMLKYSAGKALAWLKRNTELAMGAGGTGPLREGEETFIQFMKKEMDWNKPSISIIHKDSDDSKYLRMLGLKDGWKEAYSYKGMPGSSIVSQLKSAASKYAQGQKIEIKRGAETSARSQYHDYFIIFR